MPDLTADTLSSYKQIFTEMQVASQKQLELAKTSDMDEKSLADFNRLTDERQSLIDKLKALPLAIDDVRELEGYQSQVDEIQRTIISITDNDKICSQLMQEKRDSTGVKLAEARTNKKARKAYKPVPTILDPWFFDAKK